MKFFLFYTLSAVLTFSLCRPALGDDSSALTPNVFVSSRQLPTTLKRVVVLPMASETSDANMTESCKMLEPVLHGELIKTGKFEVVTADPEALRSCTGRSSWTGTEIMPSDFFGNLKQIYGCDAVLFCELTEFRPTPPLAVGWRLKLVDAGTGQIIWATDEIFDAANLDVAKDAERFQRSEQPHHNIIFYTYTFLAWCVHTPTRSALDDQWNILHSPRYFGEYSAEKLLTTLPAR